MTNQPNAKPHRKLRWSPLKAVALPALLLLAFDPHAAEAGPPDKSSKAKNKTEPTLSVRKAVNQIDGLTVQELDDGTTILRLSGNVKPTFNVYRLSSPDRLVVDISSSERGKAVPHVPVDSWAVGRVTISSVTEHDSKLARVVVNLKRESSYIVVPKGKDLVVTVTPKDVAPEAYFARKSAGKRQAEIESMRADAEREVESAEREVESAKKRAKSAKAEADSAEGRADDAEKRAEAAATRAEKAQKEAEAIRAEAEAIKAQAEAEAAKLADEARENAEKLEDRARENAEKLEDQARENAEKLENDARVRAKKIESAATDTLHESRKVAEKRAEKLADSEAKAVEAERKAAEAEQRARQAQAEAVAADAYAERMRENQKAEAKTPAALLADAEAAMLQAEEDSTQAKTSQAEAEAALTAARKALRKHGKKKKGRQELERAVAQAEAAAEAAQTRAAEADERLATLTRGRDALQAALTEKRAVAQQIDAETHERQVALANAQREVEQAEASYRALGGPHGPKDQRKKGAHRRAKNKYAAAQADLAEVRDAHEAIQSELVEHTGKVAEAGDALDETLAARHERNSLTQEWEREREAAGDATVKDVRFVDRPDAVKVVVELDGPVIYDASSLTPNMNMLELRHAKIPRGLERSLDTTSFQGPVDRITSFREGDDVKIVVASSGGDPAGIELDRKRNRLIWTFPKSGSDRAPAKRERDEDARYASRPTVDAQPEADTRVESSEVVSLGTQVSGFSTPPVLAARPGATQVGRRTKWRGERIDIELQDAPIKDVLLLFSDIGRVNIIAGPEVQGSVTMKLSAVPWDQALDIILRSLSLGMVQEGNVIRVATQASLEAERRKAIEEANAQVQLKPLETRLIPLSYGTVQDMVPKVQSVLSSRGSVTPDSRTNQLIVMDVAENIALAESLVRQLDTQTPQVLIEARIVEARTNWLRQLGIQWGFDFISSPGTGNPTGLLFPNSIGLAGGSGSNQSPVNGLILPGAAANPNYAVDLPAPVSTGTGGALGFSFGSLSGNLNTNLRLSAAEDEGEVRIISAPKIVTLDNTEAQIEQGVQIPISQVSAQGVNTRYVNATLGLVVTPHVTNEGAVLLNVAVQKNEADFVNTGARGDPTILTKSARSQLLITDGDTAVIGGIYTRNQAVNRSKVPWFADIPIIGWFFKNKTERDDRSEMLIFLTPRIVNRSESIGG